MLHIISRSFQQAKDKIREHKWLFILIVIVQIILLILLFWLTITYQIKIFQDVQGLLTPLQNANYDPASIQEGQPFLKDIRTLQQSYTHLRKDVTQYIGGIIFLFLLGQGALWLLSHQILERSRFLQLAKQWVKLAASSMILLGPFFVIVYFLAKTFILNGLNEQNFAQIMRVFLLLFGFMYYLLLTSWTIIPISSWKEWAKKFIFLAFKRIYYTLPVLISSWIVIIGTGALLYFSVERQNIWLIIVAFFLGIIILVITRIFFIAVGKDIAHEKNNH